MHRELVRPDDRRQDSPRPAAATADPRLVLASRLGNHAFTQFAQAAAVQRLLAVKESSIEERDLDSYLMVYPSKVKPLIQEKVPMPLRGQVHDKLQSWASAPGVMPWKFDTYEAAVLAALADVQGVPQLPPDNPGPTGSVPDDSDVLFGKGGQETIEKKTKKPSKEDREHEARQQMAILEKEFLMLFGQASKRLLAGAEFECNDWAEFETECTSYLAALSLELQQVVTELIKTQSAFYMCDARLCWLRDAKKDAQRKKATAEHARERLEDLNAICVLKLDGDVQLECIQLVAGYLNVKESELTESVKTAQKKPRASDLARVRFLMYKDVGVKVIKLAKLMPSAELMKLLTECGKQLIEMALVAKKQADQKSELHAGRNQGSHF